MGVAPHVFRPETHKAKQFDNPVDLFLLVSLAVDQQRLADDVEQGHPRIQRRKRVLKDHLHLTPKRPKPVLRDRRHVQHFAVVREQNLAGRRGDGSQDTAGCRGLSATALADEREGLSSIEKE